MINIPQSPSTLLAREWFAEEFEVDSIKIDVAGLLNCRNHLLQCCDTIEVFASTASTDAEINDISSFINEVGASYTVVATLTESDGTEHIITDNTYGLFYSIGTLKAGVWGFQLNWNKVANLLGFGHYTFTIVTSNGFGRAIPNEEFCYKLIPFSCDNADGTVRITTFKNGYIENGFDYRNLSVGDWKDQIRLDGYFKFDDYETIVDNLLLSNRDLHQIQTQIVDNFNLVLKRISPDVSIEFVKDSLLANRMFIDDYNVSNVYDYKEKFVSLVSIDKPIQSEINGTLTYLIKFTEFNQSTLKRNF